MPVPVCSRRRLVTFEGAVVVLGVVSLLAAVVAGLAVAALVVAAGAVGATGELATGVSEAKETESPLAWQLAMAPVE